MQQATQEVSSMDMEKVFFTRDLSDKTMDDKLLLNPNYDKLNNPFEINTYCNATSHARGKINGYEIFFILSRDLRDKTLDDKLL